MTTQPSSLVEAMKKRADFVQNWIPDTLVIPLDEVLWEINQHDMKLSYEALPRVDDAMVEALCALSPDADAGFVRLSAVIAIVRQHESSMPRVDDAMVERVAAIIYEWEPLEAAGTLERLSYNDLTESLKDILRNLAKAAIAALTTPKGE
jgi:hypothetical protein